MPLDFKRISDVEASSRWKTFATQDQSSRGEDLVHYRIAEGGLPMFRRAFQWHSMENGLSNLQELKIIYLEDQTLSEDQRKNLKRNIDALANNLLGKPFTIGKGFIVEEKEQIKGDIQTILNQVNAFQEKKDDLPVSRVASVASEKDEQKAAVFPESYKQFAQKLSPGNIYVRDINIDKPALVIRNGEKYILFPVKDAKGEIIPGEFVLENYESNAGLKSYLNRLQEGFWREENMPVLKLGQKEYLVVPGSKESEKEEEILEERVENIQIQGVNYELRGSVLERIYTFLGKGNAEEGRIKFQNHLAKNEIRIEEIGVNKKGEPKFYIAIDLGRAVKGSFNYFMVGFSPKGTARAIIKQNFSLDLFQGNVQHFMDEIKKQKDDPRIQFISRVMNLNQTTKATQLGGIDLKKFSSQNDLSESDLLYIAGSVSKGLSFIHELGFVHKDLNIGNVVVDRKENRELDVKIIDWDLVGGGFPGEADHGWQGSPDYLPPELTNRSLEAAKKRAEQLTGPGGSEEEIISLASKKINDYKSEWAKSPQDLWALMYVICEIALEKNQFLSPKFLERFEQYQQIITTPKGEPISERSENDVRRREAKQEYLAQKENLFDGLEPETKFDKLVYQMAFVDPERRISAQALLRLV